MGLMGPLETKSAVDEPNVLTDAQSSVEVELSVLAQLPSSN
ncbi:MAG: hypothetical protein ABIN89_28775 [Chitinophagaceae bacterium]